MVESNNTSLKITDITSTEKFLGDNGITFTVIKNLS